MHYFGDSWNLKITQCTYTLKKKHFVLQPQNVGQPLIKYELFLGKGRWKMGINIALRLEKCRTSELRVTLLLNRDIIRSHSFCRSA